MDKKQQQEAERAKAYCLDLTDSQLAQYFGRIEYTATPSATLKTLTEVMHQHAMHVPFESLDIHRRPREAGKSPISLHLSDIFQKIVGEGRGGYCFEQNKLLAAVLLRLGFRLRPVRARVVLQYNWTVGPTGCNHQVLLVEVEGEAHLVDVAFGAEGPLQPMKLRDRAVCEHGAHAYRLSAEGSMWTVEHLRADGDGWTQLCRFNEATRDDAWFDFVVASFHTATFHLSTFVNTVWVAKRCSASSHVSLINATLTSTTCRLTRGGGGDPGSTSSGDSLPILTETKERTVMATPAEYQACLAREFGIRLPLDECTHVFAQFQPTEGTS